MVKREEFKTLAILENFCVTTKEDISNFEIDINNSCFVVKYKTMNKV